jgi:hypothetical protein
MSALPQQHEQAVKHAVDALAALGVLGTLAGYLPAIAAFLGCVWYACQIYGFASDRWARRKYRKRRAGDR